MKPIDIFKLAGMNKSEELRVELSNGYDPNTPSVRAGTILLQLACGGNALDSIRVLLEAGADPNKQITRVSPVDGRTFKDHYPLLSVRSVEAAAMLVAAGARLDLQDGNGWTPLAYAIYACDVALCAFYLEHGAPTDTRLSYDGEIVTLLEFIDKLQEFYAWVNPEHPEKTRPMIESLEKIRSLILAHNEGKSSGQAP